MRIIIQVLDADIPLENDFIPLDVFPDMTVADLKALIEGDINIPPAAQHLFHNNQVIQDSSQTLERLQVKDGDMFALAIRGDPTRGQQREQGAPSSRNAQRPRKGPDPEAVRLQILGDPKLQDQIRETAPKLLESANDPARFREAFDDHQRQVEHSQAEKEAHIAALNDDPFNADAQREIEEMIRLERVQENVQEAFENNPEVFGRVTMLYVPVEVNGVPVKAFVDSGAMTTIMSPACAERTGIMRLIDRRWEGLAVGVGTAKILGRVHVAELQLGNYALPASFTVMEGKDVDLLLGLDNLKRHQMEISLRENCLKIHEDKIPFLSEHELPKNEIQAMEDEPTVEGPDGSRIGTQTGAIKPASSGPSSTPAVSGSAPQASSSSQQPASTPAQPRISPDAVNKITELGFSREEAIQALAQVNGDVELAIGLLL